MTISPALYSSSRSDWETPSSVVAHLKTGFDFDLDVSAVRPNVADRFFSPTEDGLAQEWSGLCWMNPPYGRGTDEWWERARLYGGKRRADGRLDPYHVKREPTTVVALLPARTDTIRWQDNVIWADFVVFCRGRFVFEINGEPVRDKKGRPAPAPFPSAFVVWGPISVAQKAILRTYGIGYDCQDYRILA